MLLFALSGAIQQTKSQTIHAALLFFPPWKIKLVFSLPHWLETHIESLDGLCIQLFLSFFYVLRSIREAPDSLARRPLLRANKYSTKKRRSDTAATGLSLIPNYLENIIASFTGPMGVAFTSGRTATRKTAHVRVVYHLECSWDKCHNSSFSLFGFSTFFCVWP